MVPEMEIVLPGRMDQLELFSVDVETYSPMRIVTFTFMLDKDARDLVMVAFDVDKRLWWVNLDEICSEEIPELIHLKVNDQDALRKLRYVLVDFRPKTACGIKAIKKWRNKLQVWPAKLLTLNK